MTAIAYERIQFSRPFTPEEHAESYQNKLYWDPLIHDFRISLGITYVSEISPDSLLEQYFYTADSASVLETYFTPPTPITNRLDWLKQFSVQCGNIITINDPLLTIEIVTDINEYKRRYLG